MDREKTKDAGLALVLILLLAAWLAADLHHPLIAAAVLALLVCLVAPKVFFPFAVIWYGLSTVLGSVVSRLVLTAVYLTVVVPMGLVRRLAGADPMLLKRWKKADGSVFVDRQHRYTGNDIDYPY